MFEMQAIKLLIFLKKIKKKIGGLLLTFCKALQGEKQKDGEVFEKQNTGIFLPYFLKCLSTLLSQSRRHA